MKKAKSIFYGQTRAACLLFALLWAMGVQAQEYGNEWIEYGADYYKVFTDKDGLYRLTYDELKKAGFPVDGAQPKNFKMFYHGKEMAVQVAGEADGRFDQGDYVEFYGKRNDGSMDALMFDNPVVEQTNPYAAIYCDWAPFFFVQSAGAGKRRETLSNQSGPAAVGWAKNLKHYSSDYALGPIFPGNNLHPVKGSFYSHWMNGKGKTGGGQAAGKHTIQIEVKALSPVSEKPFLKAKLTGRLNEIHLVDIYVGNSPTAQRLWKSIRIDKYQNGVAEGELEYTDLPASDGILYFTFDNRAELIGIGSLVSLSHIELSYPQKLSKTNAHNGIVYAKPSAGKNYALAGLNTATDRLIDITDPHQTIELLPSPNGAEHSFTIAEGPQRSIRIVSEVLQELSIVKRSFSPIAPQNFDYLIVSHDSLMSPFTHNGKSYQNAVQEYANYRATPAGGSYKPLAVSSLMLYDMFGYGEFHPHAIRRFAKFMYDKGKPKSMFLIGKGMNVNSEHFKNLPASWGAALPNFVPPYGYPGADITYTANFDGKGWHGPAIPVGRLSVSKKHEIIDYLNKVKEHELRPFDNLARKNVLHLTGGGNASEISLFKTFALQYQSVAENEFMGGQAQTKSKTTTNAIEFINVVDKVNEGLNLMTFFGHSSLQNTDIDIGYVSNPAYGYANKGKYPMIMINGCNAGSIFGSITGADWWNNNASFGEDWIKTADKGAILFLAHSHLGYDSYLHIYTQEFYQRAFGDSLLLNRPVGEAIQAAVNSYIAVDPENERRIIHGHQYVLQGDPAIKLFAAPKPDYMLDDSRVFFENYEVGRKITADTDSFKLILAVPNLGRVDRKQFNVSVKRTVSGTGKEFKYAPETFRWVYYEDTLAIKIKPTEEEKIEGSGLNIFEVALDPLNEVDELNEANNIGKASIVFPRSGVKNLAPANFSIVNKPDIKLLSQSADPLSPERGFLFQLDTTIRFDSPLYKEARVTAKNFAEWATKLPETGKDTTAFYWRSRFSELGPEDDPTWAEASFTYIKNKDVQGWGQSHWQQMTQNSFKGLQPDDDKRQWDLASIAEIVVKARSGGSQSADAYKPFFALNDSNIVKNQCWPLGRPYPGLAAVVFDQYSLKTYKQIEEWGSACGSNMPATLLFIPSVFKAYLEMMNEGDYIVLLAQGTTVFSAYDASVKPLLESIGIPGDRFASLKDGYPYIAIGQKGAKPGSAIEVLPNLDPASALTPYQQILRLEKNIKLSHIGGFAETPKIGPAEYWQKLYLQVPGLKTASQAGWSADVYGVSKSGYKTLMVTGIRDSVTELGGTIRASEYPYLQVRFNTSDSLKKEVYQLNNWFVSYKEVPEGVLLYDTLKQPRQNMTYLQGDTALLYFKFDNLASGAFADSLTMEYNVKNLKTGNSKTLRKRLPPLPGGASLPVALKIPTKDFPGENKVIAFMNPYLLPERIFTNNSLEASFSVTPDKIHPLIDVTFDGAAIMNGDLVSASPLISVRLTDENKFLKSQDTSALRVFIKKLCENCGIEQKLSFASPKARWSPNDKNGLDFHYQTQNLVDGVYELSVEGNDGIGNSSGIDSPSQGTQKLRINFEVVNKNEITNFYPYPNPFSNSVRFVFTLTGSKIPDQIKIQVMTVSGIVVREITQDEIGPIRVGNNITQYAWDGKDEYGDQLANGVYLYRVILGGGGEEIGKRETAGDGLFKHGFGKIYLMR